MTNLFLDCEFNGFGGELISMGIVSEGTDEFYEVLELPGDPWYHPWVKQNVLPILNKEPVDQFLFQTKLHDFLSNFSEVHIIVDWPDDIKYFCQSLITEPGTMINIPRKMTFEIDRTLSNDSSAFSHNALEDAKSIKRSFCKRESGKQ